MNFPDEKILGEEWIADSQQPIDNSKDGDDKKHDPPEPEEEEVLLIEHVVTKDTQEGIEISVARCSAKFQEAGNLGRENFAHGIMQSFAVDPKVLVIVKIEDNIKTILPKLVV